MADVQKTIEILFKGDDKLSSTIRGVSSELEGLSTGFNAIGRAGDIIESVAAPFATLGKGVLATEAALGALAAGGLAYAISKSIDFEAASADLNKVLGEESSRLQEAQDKALELSSKYGVASSAVLASMADFKQAGFDLSGAMELTAAALDLVIAGDISAAEASDILVASLKGFKAPAEDAGRLTDILNEVSNKYATNVRELGVGMANLSPIASQMGFSFEETAGILTPVIEVFRSGDEAAVALKTGLLKLIDDSKPVRDALASIGVSQKDANGEMRSGKDILMDVSRAFEGLDQNQKIYLASQLVGIHQAGRMVEVFDGLDKSLEITNVAMGAAGSAAEEVAIRLATAEGALDRFKVGFENLGIAVGNEFLVAVTDVIQGATEIEDALQNVIRQGAFDPVFARIREYGEDFAEILNGIAAALPEAFEQVEFGGLLDAMDELRGSFKGTFQAIFGDLDLTKPEGLAEAIQKIVDGVKTLTNVTAGIVERLNPLIEMFVDWAEKVGAWDADMQKAVGNRLADALIIDKFGGILGSVLIAVTGDMAGLNEALSEFDIMGDPFAVMADGATSAADSVGKVPDVLDEVIDAIGEAARGQGSFADAQKDAAAAVDEYAMELFRLGEAVTKLPDEKTVDVSVAADQDSIREAVNYIEYELPDGRWVRQYIQVDAASLESTREELEKVVPPEKLLQIQADIDIARIKEQSAIVQSSIEWKAKLDIAKAESDMKKFVALVESVSVSIESTGNVLSGLFDIYLDADAFKSGNIEMWLRKEYELREKSFALQESLANTQMGYLRAKAAALSRGDALITISGDGLEPELEAFMYAVLSRIQVRATQEGADFLVGI